MPIQNINLPSSTDGFNGYQVILKDSDLITIDDLNTFENTIEWMSGFQDNMANYRNIALQITGEGKQVFLYRFNNNASGVYLSVVSSGENNEEEQGIMLNSEPVIQKTINTGLSLTQADIQISYKNFSICLDIPRSIVKKSPRILFTVDTRSETNFEIKTRLGLSIPTRLEGVKLNIDHLGPIPVAYSKTFYKWKPKNTNLFQKKLEAVPSSIVVDTENNNGFEQALLVSPAQARGERTATLSSSYYKGYQTINPTHLNIPNYKESHPAFLINYFPYFGLLGVFVWSKVANFFKKN